jgi:hypothetical protein
LKIDTNSFLISASEQQLATIPEIIASDRDHAYSIAAHYKHFTECIAPIGLTLFFTKNIIVVVVTGEGGAPGKNIINSTYFA